MINPFRRILGRRSKVPPGDIPTPTNNGDFHTAHLDSLLLERFLKPRLLQKAAPGWPDELADPIVQRLINRGELAVASLDTQIQVTYRVKDLKAMLKERGLLVSGTKPVLVQRLIASGFGLGEDLPSKVYVCTSSGRAKVEEWSGRRTAALENAVSEAIELLREGRIRQSIRLADEVQKQWPTIQDVAVRFNPLAISSDPMRQERLIEIILSAQPGILSDLGAADLDRLRMAVSLWQIGLTVPGIECAMKGYVGSEKLTRGRPLYLLLYYATNIANIERIQSLGLHAADLNFDGPCRECAKLDGKRYALENLPELPNPRCVDDGCNFYLKSVIPGIND